MASTSLAKAQRLRNVRTLALQEATDRFNHELRDDQERLVLLERLRRLKKSLAK